jgi:cation:H+ antiporter
MHWIEFLFLGAVIIVAGRYLARAGEILAEKTGMGRTWIGTVLIAATTSLPELFSGVGSTAVFPLPEIAVGDVLGSCMFNLLTLSMMDAIGGNAPLSARASPATRYRSA